MLTHHRIDKLGGGGAMDKVAGRLILRVLGRQRKTPDWLRLSACSAVSGAAVFGLWLLQALSIATRGAARLIDALDFHLTRSKIG
ncbi:hypothetical protein O0544_14140 [Edwardsiella anguillarum]|nr:hypothetical protein [Edwardsiella anguillarum]